MLSGLSVIDGSMATSVARRRVWWRVAGASLIALAVAAAATAGASADALYSSRGSSPWSPAVLVLPLVAIALGVEGLRLVSPNRKSKRNLNLHRWSIGFWIAVLVTLAPVYGMLVIPILIAQRADRSSKASLPPSPAPPTS